MLIPISSIYSLGCVRKFIYLWLYYAFRFFFSIRKWAFNKRKTNGMFRPRLIPFHDFSNRRWKSYNEHAYFASVFQVCDVRHVWRKLSPQPARLDPNQKRNNLDISHLRRVGAGICTFLPFASKRVMPNVQINIAPIEQWRDGDKEYNHFYIIECLVRSGDFYGKTLFLIGGAFRKRNADAMTGQNIFGIDAISRKNVRLGPNSDFGTRIFGTNFFWRLKLAETFQRSSVIKICLIFERI